MQDFVHQPYEPLSFQLGLFEAQSSTLNLEPLDHTPWPRGPFMEPLWPLIVGIWGLIEGSWGA